MANAGQKAPGKEMAAKAPMTPLSPEEAERAAAAFVPLWQLDEAPFEAGAGVPEADLAELTGPLTAPLALQLAPPPVIGAPSVPTAQDEGPVTEAGPPTEQMPAGAFANGASETMRTALVKPLPARPTEPELPSVIVEAVKVLPAEVLPPPKPAVVPPAPPAPVAIAAPPASEGSLPSSRSGRSDASTDSYMMPRKSRAPLVVASMAIGVAVVLAGYFVTSASSAPEHTEPVSTHPPPGTPSPGTPTVATVAIPPPPPPVVAEAPPTPPTPVVVAPPPPPVAAPPPVAVAPSPPPRVSAPPPAATPRWTPVPPAPTPRKPTKPSSPPPSSGGIVRDNPF